MGIFDGLFGSKKEEASTATADAPAANTNMPLVDVEQFDVVPEDFRVAVAKLKGRAVVSAAKVAVSVVYPISAAIAADERRKEIARKKAEEEALKNPTPGKEIAGEGILLGQVKNPKDRDGKVITGIFNLFAAPEDLTNEAGKKETFKYVDAVKRVKGLKGFHGHDGESYATDKEFYKALRNGTYKGGWIIPTREMLIGTEADGPTGIRKGGVVQADNLYDHREKGALKGTFCTKAASGSGYPQWYWSCTEHREDPDFVWDAVFSDGNEVWDHKDYGRLSCRLVRLVPVAP